MPKPVTAVRAEGDLLTAQRIAAALKSPEGYRYKTAARIAEQYHLSDLRDPLVVKFAHAREPAEMVRFLSAYGLPVHWGTDALPTEHIEDVRRVFSAALNTIKNSPPDIATREMNKMVHRFVEGGVNDFGLAPIFEFVSAEVPPRLTLVSFSLRAFMAMELAIIASRGAAVRMCEQCGRRFVTGPTTGRRGDAKYCSTRCRVAADRARKKAAETP